LLVARNMLLVRTTCCRATCCAGVNAALLSGLKVRKLRCIYVVVVVSAAATTTITTITK